MNHWNSTFKVKGRTKPKKRATGLIRRNKRPKKGETTKLKHELWQLCRQIIKNRYGNVCFTCGLQNLTGSNWQTGHFIASSICSTELRYSLDNLRPQCAACNIWKSGNWLAFENHLLQEKGSEWVAQLKKKNEEGKGKKYGNFYLKEKIAEYTKLLTPLQD